ncbi:MAG: acyltransferase [Bacteroidetes bacterium]|nr:acyltransferase [Bacteroidota bacterium]
MVGRHAPALAPQAQPPPMDHRRISYFPGLNGLRFLAALLVVMHHSESIMPKYGLPHWDGLGLFRNGGNAVTFFFVLSGFLITYILLREHRETGRVHVGRFYMKRVLRIWPLYFLLVLIGLVLLPLAVKYLHLPYQMPYSAGQVWYWFVFFLPGIVTFKFGHHLLEPLWSIGVEEVYYLGWAPLFKALRKHLPLVMLAVVGIKSVLALLAHLQFGGPLFAYLVETFQFEAMAIGGLGAWLVFTRGNSLAGHWLFQESMQVLLLLVLVAFLVLHGNVHLAAWRALFETPVLSSLLVQLLFLHLIISIAVVRTGPVRLANKFWDYLGGISYGIYMYHMLLVFASMLLLKHVLAAAGPVGGHLLHYAVVVSATIGVSALSKRYFEDPFLRLKNRFGIASGR